MKLVDGQVVAVLDSVRPARGGQHRDIPTLSEGRGEVIDHDLAAAAHVKGVRHEEQARSLTLILAHEAAAVRGMIRRHWT